MPPCALNYIFANILGSIAVNVEVHLGVSDDLPPEHTNWGQGLSGRHNQTLHTWQLRALHVTQV